MSFLYLLQKNLMYRIAFFYCFLLVISCKDQPSSKKNHVTTTTKQQTVKNKITKKEVKKETYPKLNSENAIPFFAEYGKKNKENKVRLITDFGSIEILLFNNTKYHRANFIFLSKQKYFKNTQFYRVINNFVIQGGDSDDQKTANKRFKIGEYLLPTDTNKGHKHNRGVISMPSSEIENPYKLASPFEFFIVQRKGGAHNLDGDYTVFGQVTKGMDVVDKIAAVKTDETDWPMKNVFIRDVEIIN